MARWYHYDGEQQHGPLDLDAIRELVLDGAVTPDMLVWSDGMPGWLPAQDVPALTPPSPLRHRVPHWPPPPGAQHTDPFRAGR